MFDKYADTYEKEIQSSINFIGKDVDFFIELKVLKIINFVNNFFPRENDINILDVGCGIGIIDSRLKRYFKKINGIDIEPEIIERARTRNPEVNYTLYETDTFPFPDNTFEFVFAVNVFHHVPVFNREKFTSEMYRVLKPSGVVMIFEHNPYNLLTRLAVMRCEFDRDAILLRKTELLKLLSKTGFEDYISEYIIFFPFRPSFFRRIENKIKLLPLGAQYFISATKK